MIDFRYHVVSIAAVFLALALGLFIGSTSLRGKVGADISKRAQQVASKNGSLRSENGDLKAELERDQSFDAALLPYAVAGRLAGESVVVVSAPGVDDGLRKDVVAALTQAGATVNGDIRLQDALLDPQQDEFLKTLADRVAAGRTLPTGSGAERALALLADVIGTGPHNTATGAGAINRVLSAYRDGKLLSVSGDTPHPAALGLLLAAPAPTNNDQSAAEQQATLLGEFAHDLDRASTGVVVAGPAAADASGGLLDVIRGDSSLRDGISTVDSADFSSGVIATVMALAEQSNGRAGSYGSASGADAPLPSPSAAP